MDIGLLEKKFALMGARLKAGEAEVLRWGNRSPTGINIRTDRRGEFFDIRIAPGETIDYEVADLRPDLRHLLLLARRGESKEKFLCGHDERHWFVCAVPGTSVARVGDALASLQPSLVRSSVQRRLRRGKNRFARRNEAFVRQGEWFFVPAPRLVVNERMVSRNEPLRRGFGSKPHMCQFAYRTGGRMVMVCKRRPRGVFAEQYNQLLAEKPEASGRGWQPMMLNPELYVRGRVRHSDHKTVVLDGWHRVVMNTEGQAPWAPRVVFLD